MTIALVAYGQKGEIGLNKELLWHLPMDLKRFKSQTLGHAVVMGRKTYESIGKPLPNRSNLVVSRNPDWRAEGVQVFSNLDKALKEAGNEHEYVFVIGGGEIYKQSLARIDEVWATEVHAQLEADAFFPLETLHKNWKKEILESHPSDEKHAFAFDFVRWRRA